MANEISVSVNLSFAKSGRAGRLNGSGTVTMAGSNYAQKTQNVGTVEETIDKGDISTIGYLAMINRSTVNYVEIGPSAGVYAVKLKAGEVFCGRWDAANVLAKANTAACDVEYLMIED